jgi:hypothetical protein
MQQYQIKLKSDNSSFPKEHTEGSGDIKGMSLFTIHLRYRSVLEPASSGSDTWL